jgi:glutaredoxin
MNNYFLKIILLENCPYSIALDKLIKNNNIPNNSIWVNQTQKNNYKTDQIDTFPQIYLNKMNNKDNLLFGGYDDFSDFFSQFKSQKLSDDKINFYMKKLQWSKKAVLRLIQLIN